MDRGGKFTLTYEVAASRAVSDSTPIAVRATLMIGVQSDTNELFGLVPGTTAVYPDAPGDVRPSTCSLRDSAVAPTENH